ncbi:MAG TPA: LemA family protein [Longimicrobiales bacterium]|nr:LemA family protein [Longimicrobiales bacterium]
MWLLIVLILLVVVGTLIYNGLVRLNVQADNAWSDIDVQLKRRADLVPNLVETVKGYAGHEKDTLERVVQARTAAVGAQGSGPEARAGAENMLSQALRQLFALSEAYPQLQASQGFRDLQASLQGIEGEVASARRYYNAVVRDLNTRIRQVPSNVVARAGGFHEREFFEADDADRAVPEVRF